LKFPDIEEIVRTFLHSDLGLPAEQIDAETTLVSGGLIDANGVQRLAAKLESELGIDIPVGDRVANHFDSPQQIVAYLRSRLDDFPHLRVALAEALLHDRPESLDDEFIRTFSRTLHEEKDLRQPGFVEALRADAKTFFHNRYEPFPAESPLDLLLAVVRLSWGSDAFLGLVLYRLRTVLRVRGVPLLPMVLHRLCMTFFQICIGNPVVLRPGIYLPHGQVVIDGFSMIGSGTVIAPWTTIGVVKRGIAGPQIEDGVFIGTGAKILGNVSIGTGAKIGANAVVLEDVPPHVAVAGVPARIVSRTDGGGSPPPPNEP
jgi:serine O-acetyltransferase